MAALTAYLNDISRDGTNFHMTTNAIQWGQLMFAAGILLGQLGQETSLTEVVSLLRSMNLGPESKDFQMRVLYLYEAHRERQVPLVPPPFETDRTLNETGRSALDLSQISVDYTNNQVSKSSLSSFGNDVN